jgi:diaminopimelate decarboxylase
VTIFDLLHSTPTDATTPYEAGREVVDGGHGAPPAAVTPVRGDQHDALGRLTLYRKAFRATAITCPAELLRQTDIEAAVRKHGHTVDVHSLDELGFAISVGIPVARIVVHDDGRTAAPIRCGANAGVGRFVVACSEQIKVLARCVQRPQRILVDVTTDGADATVGAAFAWRRLDLVGLHARLTPTSGLTEYVDVVAQMVARMAWIRRQHRVILTRVSLAGGDVLSGTKAEWGDLQALTTALEDAFDDACARFRFPRPALILTPW